MKKLIAGTMVALSVLAMTGCSNNGKNGIVSQNQAISETPNNELLIELNSYSNKWFYLDSETIFNRIKIENNYLIEEQAVKTPEIHSYVYLIKKINNEYRAYTFTNDNSYRVFSFNESLDQITYAGKIYIAK